MNQAGLNRIEELEEQVMELGILLGIAYQEAFDKSTDEVLKDVFTNKKHIDGLLAGIKDEKNIAILQRIIDRFNKSTIIN
jgi:hypothetical protein